jgi:hypothetical protein
MKGKSICLLVSLGIISILSGCKKPELISAYDPLDPKKTCEDLKLELNTLSEKKRTYSSDTGFSGRHLLTGFIGYVSDSEAERKTLASMDDRIAELRVLMAKKKCE